MRHKILAILMVTSLLLSVPGFVAGDIVKDVAKKAADAAFSEAERQAIEKYYDMTAPYRSTESRKYDDEDDDDGDSDSDRKKDRKKKDKGKGKDKNKKKGLPKGIAKKLERGGTLPPGHAKRYLPGELENQLPPAPDGYERIVTDSQILLADMVTGAIADVIDLGGNSAKELIDDKPAEKQKTPERSETPGNSERKWWQFWKD